MNTHVSDRKKRSANMLKYAFALFLIERQNIESMPEGKIITKKYRQVKTLASGKKETYNYKFQCVSINGKQHHLPKRDPKSYLWDLEKRILRRQELEHERRILRSQLIKEIKKETGFEDKKAEKKIDELMGLARKAFYNKGRYERYKEDSLPFPTDGELVTDGGDFVRSKNECLFANKLKEMGLPYVYEARIKDQIVPDFTLFIDEEIIHIELLGKLNDRKYCADLKRKKEKYKEFEIEPVYIDMTYGVDTRILGKIITDIINGKLRGKQVSCRPRVF